MSFSVIICQHDCSRQVNSMVLDHSSATPAVCQLLEMHAQGGCCSLSSLSAMGETTGTLSKKEGIAKTPTVTDNFGELNFKESYLSLNLT